ncbi:hypothetical protein HY635_02385 [Candidatus Uhrbacteria bacterium]|nr:hypothetical protein [Candidatus Uhrbacteria bacterium]
MPMLLGTARQGDAPLTGEEERVLETLLEAIERLTTDEVARWAADAIAAGASDLGDMNEALQLTAAAIAQLSMRDRETLGTMITRHPHTYFEGFHTPEDLRCAYDLAQRCETVRH